MVSCYAKMRGHDTHLHIGQNDLAAAAEYRPASDHLKPKRIDGSTVRMPESSKRDSPALQSTSLTPKYNAYEFLSVLNDTPTRP